MQNRPRVSKFRNRVVSALLRWPRPAKRIVMVSTDLVVVPAALWAAFALKFDALAEGFHRNAWLYVGVAAAATLIFAATGLYRAVVRFIGVRMLISILAGITVSAAALVVLGMTIAQRPIAPSVVVIYWLLAFLGAAATRFIARWLLTPLQFRGTRVVIYGAGDAGAQLAMAFSSGRQFALVAYADEKRALQGTLMNGVPVISPDRLPMFVSRYQVERILLAVPSASRFRRAEILRRLERLNVHVQTVPDLDDVVNGRARVDELREVDIADLLGRDPVPPDGELLDACIRGKSVMVSGAGGSIGSELCRQIVQLAPKRIVLFEISEIALYEIERELLAAVEAAGSDVEICALLGNACDRDRVRDVLQAFGVQTVYHAAAYKHVPIVEQNLVEGVRNNVFSTWYAAEAAIEIGVESFVLISTDKAVNPTSAMGASKRLAEIVLQALQARSARTRFCMVRFGNVLGSSGSVVPLFQQQIRDGGPVTVTHRDVRRYFMTIPEAAQLVLQAGSMATGGDVFVLDMGSPVQIDELARRMIKLTGLSVRDKDNPEGDVEIEYSGLRPGEKLYEELLIGSNVTGTGHPMIMRAKEPCPAWQDLKALLDDLALALKGADCPRVLQLMQSGVAEYVCAPQIHDLAWQQRVPAESAAAVQDGKVAVLAEHRAQKAPPASS